MMGSAVQRPAAEYLAEHMVRDGRKFDLVPQALP